MINHATYITPRMQILDLEIANRPLACVLTEVGALKARLVQTARQDEG